MTTGSHTLDTIDKALETAASQFQFYAEEHRRKGSTEKAATNRRHAAKLIVAMNNLRLWREEHCQ